MPATHSTVDRLVSSGRYTKHNSMTEVYNRIYIGIMVREQRVQNIKSCTNQAPVMGHKIMEEAAPGL